ncbi:hypothetical protein [Streptomyces sp. DH7]|uniref:hypothetical protein n=1 Tax=Streptomyces sp. DH7 TaxID=2857006 RepID=UPI001E521533|nr:hypothetical protein [Streptomyces sp. DH7]
MQPVGALEGVAQRALTVAAMCGMAPATAAPPNKVQAGASYPGAEQQRAERHHAQPGDGRQQPALDPAVDRPGDRVGHARTSGEQT